MNVAAQLPRITKASIVLGIASLVRFAPEIVLIIPRRPDGKYAALLTLDLLIAGLWLRCGFTLRRQDPNALTFASIAGAIIWAHSISSGYFIGVKLLQGWIEMRQMSDILAFSAFAGSRLLIYSIEFLFWPYALFVTTNLAANPESGSVPARSLGLPTVGAFIIALLLQSIFFKALNLR